MTEYSMKHPTATQEQMEQIVAAHGNITIIAFNKNAGYLRVDADGDVMEKFQATHPDWKIYPVVHLEIPRQPPLDLDALRRMLEDDKKPKP